MSEPKLLMRKVIGTAIMPDLLEVELIWDEEESEESNDE